MASNVNAYDTAAFVSNLMARKRGRGGLPFIIESLLLVVFFIASFAIILQLLSVSYAKSAEAEEMTTAISLATRDAERFANDPSAIVEPRQYVMATSQAIFADESVNPDIVYTVDRKVTESPTPQGIIYHAHITVDYGKTEVYSIDTARYVTNSAVANARMTTSGNAVTGG